MLMPGARRTYSYTLIPEAPEDAAKVLARARKILGWACEGDDRIECHGISGEALGAVTLNLTVRGRDQWWSRQIAQNVLNLVTWGLEANATKLQLRSKRQEAHTHRGYAYGRTKTYRTPREDQD
jgi:hypothetical protein